MRKILDTTAVGGGDFQEVMDGGGSVSDLPKPFRVLIDLSAVVAIEIREMEEWRLQAFFSGDPHLPAFTRDGKPRQLAEVDFNGFQYVIIGLDVEEVISRWKEVHC